MTTIDDFLNILSPLMTFHDQVKSFVMTLASCGQSDNSRDPLMIWQQLVKTCWQPMMMTLVTILMTKFCDHAEMYIVVVLIERYMYYAETWLPWQVLLGKRLLKCQRLHGGPYVFVEVNDSWDPIPDVVLKTVQSSCMQCFFNQLHRYGSYFDTICTSLVIPWLRPAYHTDDSSDEITQRTTR